MMKPFSYMTSQDKNLNIFRTKRAFIFVRKRVFLDKMLTLEVLLRFGVLFTIEIVIKYILRLKWGVIQVFPMRGSRAMNFRPF